MLAKCKNPGLLSMLTGAVYALSFPKWNVALLAWVGFIPLILAIKDRSYLHSFLWSFTAGICANIGTLFWVYPTCRMGGVNAPTSLLALTALSGYMALYWGVFGLFIRKMESHPAWSRPIVIACGWTALEFARAHLFTGFPWLLTGYSQWEHPQWLSLASVGGAYAVTFFIMLVNALLAFLVRDLMEKRWNWLGRLVPSLVAAALLALWSLKLFNAPLSAAGPPVATAILQGNIDQYIKWDQAYEDDIVDVYTKLAHEAGIGSDFIVWPETAVPGWIPNEPKYLNWVQELARETRSFLLIGAATHQQGKDYNAAFLFSPSGELLGQYRKKHLVPFGEFIPLQKIFSRWISVLNELGDFAGSRDETVFQAPWGRFSANICFESLFPDIIRRFVVDGAQITINMTNDGWYLNTAAPEQHFIASVLRAVETRTWVIRAANTGISGFIDPHGRVAARTGLSQRAVLRGKPQAVAGETIYVRLGDVFAWGCVFVVLIGWLRDGLLLLTGYRRKR
ncbi:MAG: apolipoprotein N-acyltransferase [Elusimicrobia bacterium]|nr:apolipoprotein N-acyltransferase [Elusimicrobiota bacterium]